MCRHVSIVRTKNASTRRHNKLITFLPVFFPIGLVYKFQFAPAPSEITVYPSTKIPLLSPKRQRGRFLIITGLCHCYFLSAFCSGDWLLIHVKKRKLSLRLKLCFKRTVFNVRSFLPIYYQLFFF